MKTSSCRFCDGYKFQTLCHWLFLQLICKLFSPGGELDKCCAFSETRCSYITVNWLIKGPLSIWLSTKNWFPKVKGEGKSKSIQWRTDLLPLSSLTKKNVAIMTTHIGMRMSRHLTWETCWRFNPNGRVPLSRGQHRHLFLNLINHALIKVWRLIKNMKWYCPPMLPYSN